WDASWRPPVPRTAEAVSGRQTLVSPAASARLVALRSLLARHCSPQEPVATKWPSERSVEICLSSSTSHLVSAAARPSWRFGLKAAIFAPRDATDPNSRQ